MGIYFLQDIQTTDDGDLVIDSFGDLKIANPMRTLTQCVHNVLLTNKGDLRTEPAFGSNIGTYVGSNNTPMTRTSMERDILISFNDQGAVIPEDLNVDVVAIDIDKVAVMVDVKGSFLYTPTNSTEPLLSDMSMGINLAYIYPFANSQLEEA